MSSPETQKLAHEIANLPSSTLTDWTKVQDLEGVIFTVPKTDVMPEQRLNFQQTVELYKELDGEVKRIQAKMKEIHEAVQAPMLVAGKDKVKAGAYQCLMVTRQGSKKIVAEKLLAQGVSAQVIANATEIGKGSTSLQIRAVGEKEY